MSQPSIPEVAKALAAQRGIPLTEAQAIVTAKAHALDDAGARRPDVAGAPVTADDDGGDEGGADEVMQRALKIARDQVAAEHQATLAAEAQKAQAKALAERPESKCLAAIRTLSEHLPKSDVRSILVHMDDGELGMCETMMDDLSQACADHAVQRAGRPLRAAPVGGRRAA